ncbi:hypothetical protein [Thiohalomonas denitrificans]|uniref:hypothetical protein n=1 Tax=Thiohalomonas denitrificans TaxID=415747 RepID=UPI0026F14196|nr:hypothetical protein [Thiohalomonas denitrificans]
MKSLSELDEISINALLDGELDGDERAILLERLANEPELRGAHSRLAITRDLVAHAWDDAEPPYREKYPPQRRRRRFAVAAAMILLMVGFFAGRVMGPETVVGVPSSAETSQGQSDQVIVHIMDADPARQRAALDRVENLLAEGYHRVELVAHSEALDLLRSDRSADAGRVRELISAHPDLRLFACGNTIARIERQGERVQLIEGIVRASSAVDHIVDRLQNGWHYIKA